MAWFKVDDKLHSHKKVRKARRGGDRPRDAAAIGVWVLAGSWAASNETDGFVPADELDQWDSDPDGLAARLVDAGLWSETEQDGEAGYLFHEWREYQPTREQLAQRREGARERMRRARSVRANGEDTSGVVRSTPARPDPSPKNTPAADAASDTFDTFWKLYPRKVGKKDAEKALRKAAKDTDPQVILAGLENACQVWRTTETEPRFIPHPATWLNRGSWADEVPLPTEDAAAPLTAAQCGQDHAPFDGRHVWTDGPNRLMCLGGEK